MTSSYQDQNQCYQTANIQKIFKDTNLSQLDQELDMTLNEIAKKKPPVAPRKYPEDEPKMSSIMAKVSKFEYYAKQQKIGRSQFYTANEIEISPKVFSSNSLTVNTPAKDVLGGKNLPNYMKNTEQKVIVLNENNTEKRPYANVALRNKNKIEDIVRNFDENSRNDFKLKKVNNDQKDNIYGKINNAKEEKSNLTNKEERKPCLPSAAFDRNPQYSPVYANSYDRSYDAENRRIRGN
ncbi:uncharacterized protein LOC125236917 [Leguminivora glycinivorella]|uniref:uncharacterized protein LOC125236917 n=1 Tax=Leguminivora glycinivorella TaxID=1035111 RepID=UPI00200E0119|nr:uncharacterized protein LOC125236917 [Leguminivora glycinivorella]